MRPLGPSRLQALHDVVLGPDHLFRYPADAVCAVADVVDLRGRAGADVAPSAADTAGVGAAVAVLEAGRRGEVEGGESAGFA